MGQGKFLAMMPYISADLAYMIATKQKITEEAAVLKLYGSKLYAALEQEETKVWQYSTHMLYSMFEQEEKTGEFRYPDV